MHDFFIKDFSKKIQKYISDDIHELSHDFPRLIFHYTNAQGIIGILSTHKIWATNLGFLNDPTEFVYSQNITIKTLRDFRKTQTSQHIVLLIDNLIKDIKSIHHSNSPFFISCFCEKEDLLSQWRSYGENGNGYAIGIYTNLIGLHTYNKETAFDIRPVIYNRNKQCLLITNLLNYIITYGNSINYLKRKNYFFENIHQELTGIFIDYLLIFKNPLYSEEKEWRAISISTTENLKFREKNNQIIPYIELDMSLYDDNKKCVLPVSDIKIGPTRNKKRAKVSVDCLCSKYGHFDCKISFSKVPLMNV